MLREAIEMGGLRLHFQPEVNLRTGEVLAVEALVRWEHPTRGLLTALEFITVAEETGLVTELGRWVFAEACRQLAIWQKEYPNERRYGAPIYMQDCRLRALERRNLSMIARALMPSGRFTAETSSVLTVSSFGQNEFLESRSSLLLACAKGGTSRQAIFLSDGKVLTSDGAGIYKAGLRYKTSQINA